MFDRGRATNRTRGSQILPNPDELRMLSNYPGSEGKGAKVPCPRGKEPGPSAKVPNCMLS